MKELTRAEIIRRRDDASRIITQALRKFREETELGIIKVNLDYCEEYGEFAIVSNLEVGLIE